MVQFFRNFHKWILWPCKEIQDSTKINTVWCKIRYLVQIVILGPPTDPPSSDLFFWTTLSHFLADFNKKRCQNAREIILHQISWYPKKFETWPLFCPCITDHYQQYRDDPLLFSNSLWRSLTCTLVLMFKYTYTGPTALRDLRTTEQLE